MLLFTSQDMCVVCGSFGKGAEGQLLACAQCAQCYHPYCVNSKVNLFALSPLFYNSPLFSRQTETDLNVLRRSQRQSSARAGAAWNASSAKCVGRRRTPPGFCCATTATSAITPTAWTLHCTTSRRVAGSANGTNVSLLTVRCLVESSDF